MKDTSLFSTARKIASAALVAALVAFIPALSQAQDDPPQQAGRISIIQGAVSVQPAGADDWGQAEPNLPLGPGDRVFTDQDGRAEIQIGRTYIRAGVGSDISIVEITPYSISIGIAQGRVHVHCYGLWPGQVLHINTPSGSATLNSPGEMRVEVYPDQQAALFTEFDSNAFLTGAGGFSSQLPAGSALELVGSNPVVPQWMQPSDFDPLDQWSRQRDAQINASNSYRYVSADIGGAYELDSNGEWNPQSPYGPIWFPRVEAGWAPYHNGHWVSHAPWGWTWVEEEPWGYAPFHYGRWVVFNGRWGWIPGPMEAHPVWSPALVVFAGGNVGGAGVSAWFPLGPGEPYRPWYHCSPRYIDQVNITNLRPAPGIRIQASYAGFNFGAVVFANRSAGFSAMRQEDFAAGRPVRETTVVINRTVINNVTIIERPTVAANPHIFASRPPMRPVPLAAARPTLINERGMAIQARPGFTPVAPPVRAAPQVKALPGHKIAPPPQGVTANPPHITGGAPGKPGQVEPPNPRPGAGMPTAQPQQPGLRPNAVPPPPARTQQPTQVKPAPNPQVARPNAPNPGEQGPHPGASRPPEFTAKPVQNPPAQTAPKAAPAPGTNPNQPPSAKPAPNQNGKPAPKPEDKKKPGDKSEPKDKPNNN